MTDRIDLSLNSNNDKLGNLHLGRVKRKGGFEHAQTVQIQNHPAHAQSHQEICFILIHFIVSGDSVSGQQMPGLEFINLFSCSTKLSMSISLLINKKMPTVGIFILLAEIFSCSATRQMG